MAVEKVVIRDLGEGGLRHAAIVKAGPWVFGTGLRATNAIGLIDASVLKEGRPLDAPPKAEREARHVFGSLRQDLEAAGSALVNIVRLDQYYPDWRAVDSYHTARRAALGKAIAPSTSILVDGLLNLDADMDVQVLATTRDSGRVIEPVEPAGLRAPSESGYAPCLKVGDLRFIAGQLAREGIGDVAPEARIPANSLWRGTQIKLETRYLIDRRLRPALEAGGSSLDLVLKAQVYLSHPTDLPAFLQVWIEAFGDTVPPTTIVPVRHPAFGARNATIEVNVIAASAEARARVHDVECEVQLICDRMVAARRLDELLFVAGLMAIDETGLVAPARRHPTAPYFTSSIQAQAADILAKAERIFAAAGSDLSDVVRAIHFHADLHDFPVAHGAWRRAIGDEALPFTAVQVNESMFVPGATLIMDLWGYVPSA